MKAGENILVWDTSSLRCRTDNMKMSNKLLVTWVCSLRDEVKAGDTALGFIITEAGVEAEVSQGRCVESRRGGLKTSRPP